MAQNLFLGLKECFAFAIYDKKRELIFLVRDSLGIKPLYYYKTDRELIFHLK